VPKRLNHGHPDRGIAELADRQHGVVTVAQLQTAGITLSAIRRRVSSGRLHRVHRGVYAVGHRHLTVHGDRMAAVLACAPGAVLSHRSAAALWGLLPMGRSSIDVTAHGRCGRGLSGINAHRGDSLHAADRTVREGIPCTRLERTLLDLAGTAHIRDLNTAVSEAEVLRLLDRSAVQRVLDRNPGRAGSAVLRQLLLDLDPQTRHTRNKLEQRFFAMCKQARLPRPEINTLIPVLDGQLEADFLWREARLVVETDGRQSHGTASAFERDRRRDQRLQLAGWKVVRCTWRQVTNEPEELSDILRALLTR